MSDAAYADEDGVSYWLPGRFSSLAAVPAVPGWSMAEVYYHTSISAFGAAAAEREIRVGRIPRTLNVNLDLHLNAQADLLLLNPTYTMNNTQSTVLHIALSNYQKYAAMSYLLLLETIMQQTVWESALMQLPVS